MVNMGRRKLPLVLAAFISLDLTAWGQKTPKAAAELPALLVAAASDMAPLEAPLKEAFKDATLTFTFGASGMLARQIDAGAPFDVFLSANEALMMELVSKGKIDSNDVQIFATGRLALWSKSGAIQNFDDFAKFQNLKVAMANPQHAPYGLAAQQSLKRFGIWERYQPSIVLAENVRQAFQFAESGNVDVTLTAWSLVHDKGGILVPAEAHAPIRQVGAEIRRSKQRKAARKLVEFLMSPEGRKLLTDHGLFVSAYRPSLNLKK